MFFRPTTNFKPDVSTIRAFGLVELMVSISIMTLVTTVVLVRQSAFDGAVLLRNQAYEVAFTIRQAQQLAVTGGDATRRYGVYFSTQDSGDQLYYLFADVDGGNDFDSNEQIGQTGRIDRRFFVRNVTPDSAGTLTILFERPNFDAITCPANCYVDIARVSADESDMTYGAVRRIEITPVGQISVITY